jgi:hypothetical protein
MFEERGAEDALIPRAARVSNNAESLRGGLHFRLGGITVSLGRRHGKALTFAGVLAFTAVFG